MLSIVVEHMEIIMTDHTSHLDSKIFPPLSDTDETNKDFNKMHFYDDPHPYVGVGDGALLNIANLPLVARQENIDWFNGYKAASDAISTRLKAILGHGSITLGTKPEVENFIPTTQSPEIIHETLLHFTQFLDNFSDFHLDPFISFLERPEAKSSNTL